MLSWFKGTARSRNTARELYGAVVAQARQPILSDVYGVPDTPEGRFEAIALHLCLVLERLHGDGEEGRKLGQLLTERFVTDMDDNMREMGVGDLAVPRKVKRAAAGLYERAARYRSALAVSASESDLADALRADVLGQDADAAAVAGLVSYVRSIAAQLSAAPASAVLAGRPGFQSKIE